MTASVLSDWTPGAADKDIPPIGALLLTGVSLPAAAIFESPLAQNIAWMQRFAESHGARLSPHGKTTMAPALFRRQLEAGAWGITLATAPQCRAAFAGGVTRLLMANQLVGEPNMAIVAELIGAGAEFYCVVDSATNVTALGRYFAARGQTLNVLIELGVAEGRCGCRDSAQVEALVGVIAEQSALALVGIEGYEGMIAGGDEVAAVSAYGERLVETVRTLRASDTLRREAPIVTASGSKWFDLIAEAFDKAELREYYTPVLRPGCYVVHDHGLYREAQRGVLQRRPELEHGLLPALEVFAQVQSLPEPGLAIVAMGKRDIGGDRLPMALRRYREGGRPGRDLGVAGWEVIKLMDQHAFVRLPTMPEEAFDMCIGDMRVGGVRVGDVRVGDIVAFGTSHPCLTFDKWRTILLANERLEVTEVMATCF
jgi:D-serine deaminase-like pyridoxal phosphate-dependent protein